MDPLEVHLWGTDHSMGPCQETMRRFGAVAQALGAAFSLMLGCLVLSIPNPGCFSSPQLDSVSSFVMSTPQLCTFHEEQPCMAWLVTCRECIVSSWSGKKAEGCKQLSAFWLCWSEPVPALSKLEPGICEIFCLYGG